jgi:GTP-binding protein HflX
MLVAAFRATLEEIDESDLLIHLVDASNPRWQQQVESVERILGDLGHGDLPLLVVFNKADLVAPDDLDAVLRQASPDGARECFAVSALSAASLRPVIERAGEILARDLAAEHERDASPAADDPPDAEAAASTR